MNFEHVPARQPKRKEQPQEQARRLALLALSNPHKLDLVKSPEAHIHAALDEEGVDDRTSRNRLFHLIKIELSRMTQVEKIVRPKAEKTPTAEEAARARLMRDARTAEALHPVEEDDDRLI